MSNNPCPGWLHTVADHGRRRLANGRCRSVFDLPRLLAGSHPHDVHIHLASHHMKIKMNSFGSARPLSTSFALPCRSLHVGQGSVNSLFPWSEINIAVVDNVTHTHAAFAIVGMHESSTFHKARTFPSSRQGNTHATEQSATIASYSIALPPCRSHILIDKP